MMMMMMMIIIIIIIIIVIIIYSVSVLVTLSDLENPDAKGQIFPAFLRKLCSRPLT